MSLLTLQLIPMSPSVLCFGLCLQVSWAPTMSLLWVKVEWWSIKKAICGIVESFSLEKSFRIVESVPFGMCNCPGLSGSLQTAAHVYGVFLGYSLEYMIKSLF